MGDMDCKKSHHALVASSMIIVIHGSALDILL